jgi:hypothetical protein
MNTAAHGGQESRPAHWPYSHSLSPIHDFIEGREAVAAEEAELMAPRQLPQPGRIEVGSSWLSSCEVTGGQS